MTSMLLVADGGADRRNVPNTLQGMSQAKMRDDHGGAPWAFWKDGDGQYCATLIEEKKNSKVLLPWARVRACAAMAQALQWPTAIRGLLRTFCLSSRNSGHTFSVSAVSHINNPTNRNSRRDNGRRQRQVGVHCGAVQSTVSTEV